MKIDPTYGSSLVKINKSSSGAKGSDFARLLQETLAKSQVQAAEAVSEPGAPDLPQGLYQKAQEVLGLLDQLTQSPAQEVITRLEAESQGLAKALSELPHSSGKHLLEEVALLGTVEVTKWKTGRYN